jgi:hypothetical protein
MIASIRSRAGAFCLSPKFQVASTPSLSLFEWLQREYPGRFSDGQIRTLQRRIKLWRVTEGPIQEAPHLLVRDHSHGAAAQFSMVTLVVAKPEL